MKLALRTASLFAVCILTLYLPLQAASPLKLNELISEVIHDNPDILSANAKAEAAKQKILVQSALPDPMFMFGYQNVGFHQFTYGEMIDSQWMFTASQMLPYPGKLRLAKQTASSEAEALISTAEDVKQKNVLKATELFYDLFLSYKELNLLRIKQEINDRIEKIALSMYATGMTSQEDVLMVQTEKYMTIEKQEMAKQKIQSTEAMLNRLMGKSPTRPIEKPDEPLRTPFPYTLDELLKKASANAPEIAVQKSMLNASFSMLELARKEALPDVTLAASYMNKGGGFEDMWNLTATVPLPIFYANKQKKNIESASYSRIAAQKELDASMLMIESTIKDNFTMINTSDKLMELYSKALMLKNRQDTETALSAYSNGKLSAMTVLAKIRQPYDYELMHWQQFALRETSIAKINSVTGIINIEDIR